MRSSKIDDIEKSIKKKAVCFIADIATEFNLKPNTVAVNIKKLGTLNSLNERRRYCILPQEHDFDEHGLLFIGKISFFKGGTLLDAICHLVETSKAGLGARELDDILRTTTHSQLPKLFKEGRLQRVAVSDRPGNAFVYFSKNNQQAKLQREAFFSIKEEPVMLVEEPIVSEDLPDVIEVLLSVISHPDFSTKSLSLSLQRRGKLIGKDFVSKVFRQYGLSKKNS